MGRLIDADEFKEYVSEGYERNKYLLQTDEYRNLQMQSHREYWMASTNSQQPTMWIRL